MHEAISGVPRTVLIVDDVLARVHARLELSQTRVRPPHHNASFETEVSRRIEANHAIQAVTLRAGEADIDFEQARAPLAAGRGTHVDPTLLDAVLDAHADFCGIARRHVDEA